jgi:hypothetical protein
MLSCCYTKLDQTSLKLAIQLKFPLEGLLLASTKGVGSFLSTSINSGVAHPIFFIQAIFFEAFSHCSFISANLTNRGLSVYLFTGLLVKNDLRFTNQIVLALVFGIILHSTHTNSRIQVPKKLLKLLNFKKARTYAF